MTSSLSFFDNCGDMGAHMRAHDWGATPLGDPATWPQSLRSTLSAVLTSPMLGAVMWGPELLLLYNDPYAEALADRHPRALGQPIAEVWGDSWQQVKDDFHRCLQTGVGFSHKDVEVMIERHGKWEKTVWNFAASPIIGENGKIAGLINQGMEITEQVRKDIEIHQTQATLERTVDERTRDRNRLWELSADIMLRCGFDGCINAVNPAWKDVLGFEESELVGTNLMDHIHPDDQLRTAEGARQMSEGESFTRFDNRYRHKDGTYRWISWSTRPDVESIYAVGRDFTAEKEQSEALRLAENALRQAQKMEAVGQLTGGLAHDFNNLLAGISGSLGMISLRVSQARFGDISRYVEVASDAAKRASALTHRLLAFSRRQSLDPKPVLMNDLVNSMGELLNRSVNESIRLDMCLDPELWTAEADPNQLESALLNLVLNARDAMPDGGMLMIETFNRRLDRDFTNAYENLLPGDYVVLSVRDTGCGMPENVISRAFDPFFTTKPIGQGTGLGLSMIYGFSKQSHGHVAIESQVGHGTTVQLFLPRYHGVSQQDAPALPNDTAQAREGETILLVEDDPAVRALVSQVLSELGYAYVEAGDAVGAIPILESGQRIDLMISDVGLPGMNGRQLADIGRQLRADLKVLFITGYAENASARSGFLEEGMQMITKPFAFDQLTAKVREMIEG